MRQDLTDITIVLDRSGSMHACRQDAEGGLNAFIEDQKKAPGHALLTLVQFDQQYEFVHNGVDIQTVGKHELCPRGSTALLDAIGRAITETGERLKAMSENDRPALVVFVILTDGQENASREFSHDQIKAMIQHQQDVYHWKFTYLGANQDAFLVAGDMGVKTSGIANYNAAVPAKAFTAASKLVGSMRLCSVRGAQAQSIPCDYSDEERQDMEAPKP